MLIAVVRSTVIIGVANCLVGCVTPPMPANDDLPRKQLPPVESQLLRNVHAGAKGGPLGILIASGEGSYGSFNRGVAGDAHGATLDFSQMTIGEVIARQSTPRRETSHLFAVGKYQLIPSTLLAAVRELRLPLDMKLDAALQEKIFRDYILTIKRPEVEAYITGKSLDQLRARKALASEFASVANPDTGRSNYGARGRNFASITSSAIADALTRERNLYDGFRAAGLSPQDAWHCLSEELRDAMAVY